MQRALFLAGVACLIVIAIVVFAANGTPPPVGDVGPGVGGPPPGAAGMLGVPGAPGRPMMRPMPLPGTVSSTMPPQPLVLMDNDRMKLSEDQRAKLDAFYRNREESQRELNEKTRAAIEALRDALLAVDSNDARIQELAKAAQKCEADAVAENLAAWKTIRSILNAEQFKMLIERMRIPQGPRTRRDGRVGPPPEGGAPPVPPPPGPAAD